MYSNVALRTTPITSAQKALVKSHTLVLPSKNKILHKSQFTIQVNQIMTV